MVRVIYTRRCRCRLAITLCQTSCGSVASPVGCRRPVSAVPRTSQCQRICIPRLLAGSGLDPVRDRIEIGPVPGATGPSINFGLTAAEALATGKIDGFWANGTAAELALSSGTGTIVLDVRRGDGPPGCFDYTMPVLATTDQVVEQSPDIAARR